MIEKITHQDETYAIIVRNQFFKPGVSFFTPADYSQQLAYMQHPKGKLIEPHLHQKVTREVHLTQEVLFIKSGRLRVDLYDTHQNYIESHTLEAGDVILLAAGGHGFEVLEDLVMFEVKQGPFVGEQDKTRFKGNAQVKQLKVEEI